MQSRQPENDGLDGMNDGMIASALDATRTRISGIENELAALSRALTAAREEERLFERLLALRRGAEPSATDSGKAESRVAEQLGTSAAAEPGQSAVQAVVRELAAAGRPLHISELMRVLRDHGIRIPGAGTQANLITHLRRDPRLVRPSRGMYGLAAWGLENMPVTARQTRRTKRARSAAATERAQG